ncbi:MAG: site-specific integrase, partial [Marinobacter sp.]
MNIAVDALQAPTQETLGAWLKVPRLAKCGKFFTPSELSWWPDRTASDPVNWKAALVV